MIKPAIKAYVTTLSLLLSSVFAMTLSQTAWSHGGVSIDQDVCIMQIGKNKAHFTGYQPEYRATQEFCEDIPVVGKSIFVIDFISDSLRDMELDFRIIKDVNNIGNNAVLDDLGGESGIEKATIYYKEKAIFPRGTMTAEYEFIEEGRYIGIVTARYVDDASNEEERQGTPKVLTSVFPFQVGIFDYWKFLGPLLAIILISSGVFGIFLGMARKKKAA